MANLPRTLLAKATSSVTWITEILCLKIRIQIQFLALFSLMLFAFQLLLFGPFLYPRHRIAGD